MYIRRLCRWCGLRKLQEFVTWVLFLRDSYKVYRMPTFRQIAVLVLVLLQCRDSASANDCQHPCETTGLCQTKKVRDKCYYVFTNGDKTWHETKELCATNNMSMVKVDPEVLQDQFNLKDLTERDVIGSKVWLGGKVEELQEWTYLNGVLQSSTISGKISAFREMEQCAIVSSNATVTKMDCREKFPFICRFDDWREYPSYQITDVAATWFEARSFCTSRGGDLFFLKENENILLMRNRLAAFQNQMLFIGLTYRTWRWEDGEDVKYYNWDLKEPNHNSEKCMAMYSRNGLWLDMDCKATMNAFCQKVEFAPNPSELEKNQVPTSTWIIVMALLILVLIIALICTCMYLHFPTWPDWLQQKISRLCERINCLLNRNEATQLNGRNKIQQEHPKLGPTGQDPSKDETLNNSKTELCYSKEVEQPNQPWNRRR